MKPRTLRFLALAGALCVAACADPDTGTPAQEARPSDPEAALPISETGTLTPEPLFTISGETGLHAARDLTVDQAGNVYVFDYDDYLIRKFDPQGEQLAEFGGTGEAPRQFTHLMAIRALDDSLMALDAGTMLVFELTGELRSRTVFNETITCDHPRIHPGGRWVGRWINDERADMSATFRRADGTEETRLASHPLNEEFPGVEPGGFFFLNPTQARSYVYDFLADGSVLWATSDELRVSVHGDGSNRVFYEAPATPVPFPEDEIAAMEGQQAELGPPLFMNVPHHHQLIHHLVVAESGEVWLYIKTQERTGLLRLSATGEETGFYAVEADFDLLEARLTLADGRMYFMSPGREETAIYGVVLQ